ncbi:MAG: response regulator transcription factor [Planctomycetota bacterium]|jgi:two-component system phosphate regulon response regulator PhoB
MAKETILVVEDDPDIVELLEYSLEREGYKVLVASDGEKGLSEAKRRKPALVLLDLMLPGLDGLAVCRALKEDSSTKPIPVMMLTAKGEESDVVVGLEFGADDYVRKPFSPRELIARIRAVMRRAQPQAETRSRIELGPVVLDKERHEVTIDEAPVLFTRSEFRLFWRLAKNPGRVYSRDELVESLTDGEAVILDRNIDVHVSAIRKKLGTHGGTIVTVRGVGYKVVD